MPYWTGYFGNPKGDRLGLISAALILPAIVMGFPGAWICNRWGRKWCIFLGCFFIMVGAVWNALSKTTTEFILCKLVLLSRCDI
jgi:MFS family permease